MLGRGDKAMTLLQTIPALVRESEGGNPDAMRALPLSWDALLIAGALTFLLGQLSTYRRIRASVVACVDSMPWEVRFSLFFVGVSICRVLLIFLVVLVETYRFYSFPIRNALLDVPTGIFPPYRFWVDCNLECTFTHRQTLTI